MTSDQESGFRRFAVEQGVRMGRLQGQVDTLKWENRRLRVENEGLRCRQTGRGGVGNNLVEQTASSLAKRLEDLGDGSEDNSVSTVQRALHRLFDTLEEDLLEDWQEILVGWSPKVDMQRRFDIALAWARDL
jgi:hypothetical protein